MTPVPHPPMGTSVFEHGPADNYLHQYERRKLTMKSIKPTQKTQNTITYYLHIHTHTHTQSNHTNYS